MFAPWGLLNVPMARPTLNEISQRSPVSTLQCNMRVDKEPPMPIKLRTSLSSPASELGAQLTSSFLQQTYVAGLQDQQQASDESDRVSVHIGDHAAIRDWSMELMKTATPSLQMESRAPKAAAAAQTAHKPGASGMATTPAYKAAASSTAVRGPFSENRHKHAGFTAAIRDSLGSKLLAHKQAALDAAPKTTESGAGHAAAAVPALQAGWSSRGTPAASALPISQASAQSAAAVSYPAKAAKASDSATGFAKISQAANREPVHNIKSLGIVALIAAGLDHDRAAAMHIAPSVAEASGGVPSGGPGGAGGMPPKQVCHLCMCIVSHKPSGKSSGCLLLKNLSSLQIA